MENKTVFEFKLRLLSFAATLVSCTLLLNSAFAQTEPGSEMELIFRGGLESDIAEVAIIYFTVNNKSSELLPTGATATISWYTSNAHQCNASTTPVSSLDDWTTETVVGFSADQIVTFSAVQEGSGKTEPPGIPGCFFLISAGEK